MIITVARSGPADYSGDDGPAPHAGLNSSNDLAVDAAGNLYIADESDNVVREVFASSGVISTVIGYTSTADYSGDGGPATRALLNGPIGLALDQRGNLFIAECNNGVVREVLAGTGVITPVTGTSILGYNGDGGLPRRRNSTTRSAWRWTGRATCTSPTTTTTGCAR